MFRIIAAFIVALRKSVMFGSGRRYAWPILNRFPEILPVLQIMVRGPRSKHIGPWFTDLGPRVVGFGSWVGWGCWLDYVRFKELNTTSIN